MTDRKQQFLNDLNRLQRDIDRLEDRENDLLDMDRAGKLDADGKRELRWTQNELRWLTPRRNDMERHVREMQMIEDHACYVAYINHNIDSRPRRTTSRIGFAGTFMECHEHVEELYDAMSGHMPSDLDIAIRGDIPPVHTCEEPERELFPANYDGDDPLPF